jgi:hypothetical protein
MKMTRNNMTSRELPIVLLISCIAISAIFSTDIAQAQSWMFEPAVSVGYEIDDNASLHIRTDQEIKLQGLLLDLRAKVNYTSATTMFRVEPRAMIRDYGSGDSQFDSEDFFLRSRFRHDGQASSFGFRADFDDQTVRTAERAISDNEVEDPDDITDDDSGRVILEGTRSKIRFAPNWDYRLSTISTVGLYLDYYDVGYDDEVSGTLFDYTDARLNLTYRRAFSDVNTALVTLTGRQYDSEATVNDISGVGLLVGFERRLSEQMQVTAMIGMEDTDVPGALLDPEVIGEVTLIRDLDTIRMFARYKRSVNPSGGGRRLTVRDAINLNFRRRLSEKISAGLGIRAYQTERIPTTTADDDRQYIQLQSTFLWYLSQSMVIETSYRYTISDRNSIAGERSNSNQINVWFVYQPRTVPRL